MVYLTGVSLDDDLGGRVNLDGSGLVQCWPQTVLQDGIAPDSKAGNSDRLLSLVPDWLAGYQQPVRFLPSSTSSDVSRAWRFDSQESDFHPSLR